jgi:hypothetical protein
LLKVIFSISNLFNEKLMENLDTEMLENNLEMDLEIKTAREARTQKGFKLLAIGAVILFLGCITNLTMPISNEYYHFILYGITSIGAAMVVWGLYLIME